MDPAASSGTSSTSLLLNVIFRALFSLAAAAGCWVPMRLLWKNGELAGATFTVIVIIFNLFNAINCLIWHDDNINHWWKGEGWCDIQVYVTLPLETMYAACVLAIVRHIANQVALMRVTGLSGKEKRRKLIVQCLIIFPVPLVQVALTYLILAGRYSILAVVGCRPIYAPSWLALVFFVLPCPIFALLAAYFAVVIYFRYRQIDAATRAAVWDSNNSSAQSRSARTKRKLYFMSVCVVIPYLPIQIAYLVLNLLSDGPWTGPYSFSKTHGPTWSYIFMVPSDAINWVIMYQGYISVLTVIPIFIFFARTKEAHDTYRKYLRSIGLGKIWPKLNEEWFPDRSRVGSLGSGSRSWRSRVSELASASSSLRYSRKGSLAPTVRQVSIMDDRRTFLSPTSSSPSQTTTLAETGPRRNPWVCRTMLAVHYPVRLPRVSLPGFLKRNEHSVTAGSLPGPVPLDSVTCPPTAYSPLRPVTVEEVAEAPWSRTATQSQLRTKVWSAEGPEGNRCQDFRSGTVLVQTQITSCMEESDKGRGEKIEADEL